MIITSRKFRSKYYNGDDFTSNLTDFNENLAGSVMEEKQVTFEIKVTIESKAKVNLPFEIDTSYDVINRQTGSFIADGFRIGDSINVFWNNGSAQTTACKIIDVKQNQLFYLYSSGTAFSDVSNDDMKVTLSSDLPAFKMNYGIIENEEGVNYNSFIDDTVQGWYAEGMILGGAYVDAKFNGENLNKSSKNGSLKVKWVGNTTGVYTYEVVHTFIIPYYEDGEYLNLADKEVPETLEGDKSYKYVGKFDFGRTLTNTNTFRSVLENKVDGDVGWFEEPYQGLNMPFSISNLVYEDGSANVIDKIVADTDTVVKFTVNSTETSFSDSVTNTGCLVSKLPTLEQYQNKDNDFDTNWLYDSVYEVLGTAATIGSPYVIKAYEATFVDVNTMTVEMTVNFSNVENTDNYLLAFEVATNGGNNVLSDKTVLIVGVNSFEKSNDIPDLMEVTEMFFELYPDAKGDNDFTNVEGWVEDSIHCNFKFWLDNTKEAYLESLNAKIVAYNTTDGTWFELESVPFPLFNEVLVSEIQQFNLDQERGFNIEKGDYNIIKLSNNNTTSGKTYYDGEISLKIDWQEWLKLDNADTIFYDNAKENNGLNENASNYSLVNGYEIRVFIDSVVSNGSVDTNYVFSNPQNKIYDYDKDSEVVPYWEGEIKTYDINGVLLGDGILSKGKTIIQAGYTPNGSFANERITISLEPINSPSKNQIKIYDADVTYSGGDVFGTYILDPSELKKGVKYKISSRLMVDEDSCLPNVVDLTTSYPTPKSGIFNIATDIFENDGTTPLAVGVVKFTFNDGTNDLYEATFNIGDNISSATPLSDTGVDSFADIQAHFSSAIIQNGGSFNFDKLSWAETTGYINDGTNTDEKEFTVSFQTTSPCSSNIASDTIGFKTWFEFRSTIITVSTTFNQVSSGKVNFGTLGIVSAWTIFYNSTNATFLNPTGAIFNGSNTVSGAKPASNVTIASGTPEQNAGEIQTVPDGNCLNTRVGGGGSLFQLYTSAGTWDESQTITFTRAYGNTMGFTVSGEEVKVISGGAVAVPTNAVPLVPRATGGTTHSTDSYGSAQTSLVVDIPLGAGYGVFHIESVLSATSGGNARELQDIILVKLMKY